MCGIVGFFARESVPGSDVFQTLFEYASLRGQDGFGFTIIKRNEEYFTHITKKVTTGWSNLSELEKETISNFIQNNMDIGDILLANFRAAPETEVTSNTENDLQPIVYDGSELVLVHNGAISTEIYESLKEWENGCLSCEISTNIDSEAILWAYKKSKRDLQTMLEKELCGGWSFILYDKFTDQLVSACSWNPLAHGYIKGVGYFIHSDENVFPEILSLLGHRANKCGTCLWENFYYHERDGYRFFKVDCDSGMEIAKSYKHRFIHPTWDCTKHNDKIKYVVCASGGLDSTTTACILKYFKKDVHLVHFQYGHRGEDAELLAVQKISEILDIPLTVFDLKDIYSKIDNFSMLTNKGVRVTTGMKPKTTSAWTCGRNMVFGTLLGAFSESLIMKENYKEIRICAGFNQLTESGVYPDNSEKFVYALEQLWKYGTLPGGRGQIKFQNVCRNITKTEQIQILEYIGMLDILKYTVSCDRPIVENGEIKQCAYEDKELGIIPACGSGLLSWWAMRKLNIKDPRQYYIIDDKDYKAYVPKYISENLSIKKVNPEVILKRILL